MRWMKGKISKRLRVVFTIIVVLFIMVLLVNINGLFIVSGKLKEFYNGPFETVATSVELQSTLQNAEKNVLRAASTRDIVQTQNYAAKAEEHLTSLQEQLNVLKQKFVGDEALLEKFNGILVEETTIRASLLENIKKNKNEEALNMYSSQYAPIVERADLALEEIKKASLADATDFYKIGVTTRTFAVLLSIGLSIFTIIITILLCTYLAKSIMNPIRNLENGAKEMAKGNLNAAITYCGEDELGVLADSMRETSSLLSLYVKNIDTTLGSIANQDMTVTVDMEYIGDFVTIKESMLKIISSMNQTMKGIMELAGQVSLGSDQIAQAAQTMASGAMDQSSSVEQLVATVHEVVEQVDNNAKKAEMVTETSNLSKADLDRGNQFMQQLLGAMEQIAKQAVSISDITKTVDSIASQTNMLALNASIEAARAGEHGKGFAVVASEIGNLAGKSVNATKDIASLVEQTMKVVKQGSNLADETADVLKLVVTSSNDTNELVGEIAAACIKQTGSLNEILQGIQQVASVTESNSAVAQETSASSEELLSQATVVSGLLEKFKLK